MEIPEHIAIVGGGLAGARAAEGARSHGFDGRITLVGAETHFPYERPPLSKDVLIGSAEPADARVHEDAAFYTSNEIELVLGSRVEHLDPHVRRLELHGGTAVEYDHLVLATGSTPRRLPVEHATAANVHYLRTVDDSLRLREALHDGVRVAVIGASWIGCEVAAAARQRDADVVLIDPLSAPLEQALGAEVGAAFARLHAHHGVDLRMGSQVTELAANGDAVTAVHLDDGSVEDCDVVVVGIGVEPNIGLARTAGLDTAEGILVDAGLRTSHPTIWAAGDIAEHDHPGIEGRVRVEHWATALHQGAAAGRNAAGAGEVYDRLPYFFSDQYDTGMEYRGWPGRHDKVVTRGAVDDGEFIAFYLADGAVRAAANVNVWDVGEPLERLIRSGQTVDAAQLTDPSNDLIDP